MLVSTTLFASLVYRCWNLLSQTLTWEVFQYYTKFQISFIMESLIRLPQASTPKNWSEKCSCNIIQAWFHPLIISFSIDNVNFDTVGVLNDAILLNGIRLIAL